MARSERPQPTLHVRLEGVVAALDGGHPALRPARVALVQLALRDDRDVRARVRGGQRGEATCAAAAQNHDVEAVLGHVPRIDGDQVAVQLEGGRRRQGRAGPR
jgi:hypothetical protein